MPDAALDSDGLPTEGGALRKLLVETQKQSNEYKAQALELSAEKIIKENELRFVKPEDLAGVELENLAEVAAAKEAAALEPIRAVLAAKGVAETDLDSAVAEFLAGTNSDQGQGSQPAGAVSAFGAANGLAGLAGDAPSAKNLEGMSTHQKMYAAMK